MQRTRVFLFVFFISFLYQHAWPSTFRNFSTGQGLSHKTVNCIHRDSDGFLWVGTTNGLSRFDGYGFKNYINDPADSLSLGAHIIYQIAEGSDGTLWLATNSGLRYYDKRSETFRSVVLEGVSSSISISSVCVDERGAVWACHYNYGLFVVSRTAGGYEAKRCDLAGRVGAAGYFMVWRVHYQDNFLWVGSSYGIIRLDTRTHEAIYAYKKINSAFVSSLKHGMQNELLVVYGSEGVYSINTSTLNGTMLKIGALNAGNASNSFLNDAERMPDNSLWVASSPGLYHVEGEKATFFDNIPGSPHYFDSDISLCVYREPNNTLWVGSMNDGVFATDPQLYHFHSTMGNPRDGRPYTPATCLHIFTDKSVLYGNSKGLFFGYNIKDKTHKKIYNKKVNAIKALDQNRCVVFTPDSLYIFNKNKLGVERLIANDRPHCGIVDENKIVWSGYWGQGLRGDNITTGESYHINIDSTDRTRNIVFCIAGDSDGSLWLGMYGAGLIHVKNPTSQRPVIKSYTHQKTVNSLSQNEILYIHDDERGNLWICTSGGGINSFNKKTGAFCNFTVKDGLKSNVVESVISDNKGNLWIATNIVSKYDVHAQSFTHYTNTYGLVGEFNVGACFKTFDGFIFFGGNKGILYFHPDSIPSLVQPQAPVLSAIRIMGIDVNPGDEVNGDVFDNTSVTYADKLRILHTHNSFSIEFTSLHLLSNQNLTYAYMMKGFDEDWITSLPNTRTASYTGLAPGKYVFKVKASNGSEWSPAKDLIVEIIPPWWKSWWFKTVLSLTIISWIIFLVYNRIKKIHDKNETLEKLVATRTNDLKQANEILLQQKEELLNQFDNLKEHQLVIEIKNNQLSEAIEMKDRLIGLIGHDFKNPLGSMQGFAKILMVENQELPRERIKLFAEHINNSVTTLINHMSSVLDWARGQMNDVHCKPMEVNLEMILADTITLMNDTALQKQITITSQNECSTNAYVDPRMISTVFRNILSNGLKYTPRGGAIIVVIQEFESCIDVSFIDTGVGMTMEKQSTLFSSLNSIEIGYGTENEVGTGLGLKICKTFVEKNSGSISVVSNEGEGTVFTVTLPKGVEAIVRRSKPHINATEESSTKTIMPFVNAGNKAHTVLIVDDNVEILSLLRNVFATDFNIIEAQDGQAGLQLANNMLPHVVISDINLPKESGINICKSLKENPLTSHIPVILITAQRDGEYQEVSYQHGADDYVEKPFNPYLLKQKVQSLLSNRVKYEQYIRSTIEHPSTNFEIPDSIDDKIINKIFQIVHDNIVDPDFDINTIADGVALSRTQLWRKFKNTTGKNLSDYIKDLRMQKATEMLKTGRYRISEVAFEVGFSDPKYFTKCFIKEYGMSPSAYQDQYKKSL